MAASRYNWDEFRRLEVELIGGAVLKMDFYLEQANAAGSCRSDPKKQEMT